MRAIRADPICRGDGDDVLLHRVHDRGRDAHQHRDRDRGVHHDVHRHHGRVHDRGGRHLHAILRSSLHPRSGLNLWKLRS